MIQDLCIIMLTAGITSLVFKLLKQPVVLGYIVAAGGTTRDGRVVD